jgi:hypothetical protein
MRGKRELAMQALTLALAGYLAFGGAIAFQGFSPLLLVLTLPPIIRAALRFDQPEACARTGAVSGRTS